MTKTNTNLRIFLFVFLIIGTNQIIGQRDFLGPHQGATPKFQQQNDFTFSIGGLKNKNPFGRSFQAQLGYSPFNHLGISIFHSRYTKYITESTVKYQRQSTYGINVGYYLNQQRYDNENVRQMLFGLSTGFTTGQLANYFGPNFINATPYSAVHLNLQKYYLQSELHYSFFNYLWIGGIVKLGKLNINSGLIDGTNLYGNGTQINYLISNPLNTFFEYSLKIELKNKKLGLYFQTNYVTAKKLSTKFGVADLGLTVNLNEMYSLFKKKKIDKNK